VRLFLKEIRDLKETEVEIRYKEKDTEVQNLISAVNSVSDRLPAFTESGENVLLIVSKILYFEAVDRYVFAYSADDVYKVRKTLYDLEGDYASRSFVRISKASIVNINAVRKISPEEGRRLRLLLTNGETLIVSRGYVSGFRTALGMKGDA